MFRMVVIVALLALVVARADATQVSGHITDAQTSMPIAGADFSYFLVPFGPFGDTTTDDNGYYSIDVPQGAASLGYAAPGYVPASDDREIDATPLTIDVALYKVSTISGTVRDAQSMQPLQDEELVLVRADTSAIYTYAGTDEDGAYSFDGVPPGSYGVCVNDPSDGYRDMCYDNLLVGADGVLHFLTLDVTPGSSSQGIDFALVPGAALSGTLTDSYFGGPIANAKMTVILYSSDRNPISQHLMFTDSDGHYSIGGLAVGSYYLEIGAAFDTTNTNGAYTPRLYSGGECGTPGHWSTCPFDSANPIVVPPAGTTGIDMALFPGYVVTGRVVDAGTGAGVPGVTIVSCDVPLIVGVSGTTITDANGYYALGHAVNEDTGVVAQAPPPYLSELWPDTLVSPSGCTIATGASQLIFDTPDEVLPHIDFHLPKGSALSGVVVADMTVAPLSASIAVISTTGPSQLLATVRSDADGKFQIIGNFNQPIAVIAYLDDGKDCQVYDSVPCGANFVPSDPTTADVSGAAILNLNPGDLANSIFFHLKDQIFTGSFE